MSFQKQFRTKLYTIIPYEGLSCELLKFTIHDQPAETTDFGYSKDTGGPTGDYEIDHWGCSNRQWFRDNAKRNAAMQKYKISAEEFDTVCDALENILSIGRCGWCV